MEKIPPDLPLDLLIHIMKLLDIKSFWFFCSCAKIYFSTFNNNILWKHRLAIDYQRQPYLVINERASYKWRSIAKSMAVKLIWLILRKSPYFVTIDLCPFLT